METYLDHQGALRFVSTCEQNGVRILGLDFFERGDGFVVPVGSTAWDDLADQPPERSWHEARALLRDGVPDGGNRVVFVTDDEVDDPRFGSWPCDPLPDEERLVREILTRGVIGLEYEKDGDVESAYLCLPGQVAAVAGVRVLEPSFELWPWRIALLDAPQPLPPMRAENLEPLRSIVRVTFYEDERGLERGMCIEPEAGLPLWLWSAAEDDVRFASGSAPPEIRSLEPRRVVSRS